MLDCKETQQADFVIRDAHGFYLAEESRSRGAQGGIARVFTPESTRALRFRGYAEADAALARNFIPEELERGAYAIIGCCRACGQPCTSSARVYFGIFGPFCNVDCRERHLAELEGYLSPEAAP